APSAAVATAPAPATTSTAAAPPTAIIAGTRGVATTGASRENRQQKETEPVTHRVSSNPGHMVADLHLSREPQGGDNPQYFHAGAESGTVPEGWPRRPICARSRTRPPKR